jgi:hypothetical protein
VDDPKYVNNYSFSSAGIHLLLTKENLSRLDMEGDRSISLFRCFAVPLDVGLTMTACIALGIAVDDTAHFMLRLQDTKKAMVDNPVASIKITFHQCSRAMIATTMIAGLGLSVFVLSPLAVMTRFASLMVLLLVIALVCDLVLLPTLLKIIQSLPANSYKIRQENDEPPAGMD